MLALCITGFDADPERVTDVLGIMPTHVGRKGELSKSGRVRTFNGWWFYATRDMLHDGAQQASGLEKILDQLRGREDRFAALREQIQPETLTIYGGLYVPADAQCGVWLDAPDMRLLAACGVGWGLDLHTDD